MGPPLITPTIFGRYLTPSRVNNCKQSTALLITSKVDQSLPLPLPLPLHSLPKNYSRNAFDINGKAGKMSTNFALIRCVIPWENT